MALKVNLDVNVDGWQRECWRLAKLGEEFEVLGAKQKHEEFFKSLSAAYQYDCRWSDQKVACIPRPSA